VAAVVVRDKEHVNVAGIFQRCSSALERSHIPDLLQVVDELPKTSTEKVQTRFLAQALDSSSPYVFSRQQASA
jgi:acyl-coenzyme A synthetase/AMP-(fatty) acid ligase